MPTCSSIPARDQDPLNLLVAVSKMTGRGIYDHGDILRHSKIRIKNPENEVIATYCVRGFKKTKV
jgi:hypothetical protein